MTNDKMTSNYQIIRFSFELWISFGIYSPLVHHFVRTLVFEIVSYEDRP
jgi:hypothetical protein